MTPTKKKGKAIDVPEVVKNYRKKRVLFVYNPKAGEARPEVATLDELLMLLKRYRFEPDLFIIGEDEDLENAVKKALKDGIRFFVTFGGDGTSSSTARLLAGKDVVLGILPGGSQNNTALALDIPDDIESAVRVLREGRKFKIDIGQAVVGGKKTNFVEAFSIGLVSDLFPAADDINHGKFGAVAEFFKTLAAAPPSDFKIWLDDAEEQLTGPGFIFLAVNMPVVGANFRLGKRSAMQDGKLGMLFFQDSTKFDLLTYMLQGFKDGPPKADKIKHKLVQKIKVQAKPKMSVMFDGVPFGEGDAEISILKHGLTVMVPKSSRVKQTA